MRGTMRRQTKPSLENLEAATSDDKPLAIPPGARVRVDFDAPVDTSTLLANDSQYPDELARLAASELSDTDAPPDPLTDFCSEWSDYAGCIMRVTRLADPAARRMPGQTYNRQCLEVESLGDTPFDPVNLQGTLQLINGNSGGVFRIWLIGEDSRPISGAFLNRLAIGDPPKQYNPATAMQPPYYQQQPPPPKPEPSALEIRMQQLQERLLENALTRLMTPPPDPQPQPPASTISDEDRLTLLLVKEGNLLPTVVGKLATLAGAPEAAGTKQTWSDWLKDTGGELLRTNPEIGERITNTLANVVTLVLDRLPGKQAEQPPQPQRPQLVPYSGGRVEPFTPRADVNTGLPEVPQPDDDDDDDQPIDESLEDATMIILEDLLGLLSGNEPLVPDHPVFINLARRYPVVFPQAVNLIAAQPLDAIILWVKGKSPLYANMFDSEVTGPHYRARLQELQTLCKAPAPAAPPPQPELANDATQTPQAKRRRRPPTS